MKLTDALICAQCDEIVKREADMNKQTCPSCTSSKLVPVARWIVPLKYDDEVTVKIGQYGHT